MREILTIFYKEIVKLLLSQEHLLFGQEFQWDN